MSNDSIIALVFLVLSCAFVYYLLKAIMVLLKFKMKGDGTDFVAILKIFKFPLLAFGLLILFLVFGLPQLK